MQYVTLHKQIKKTMKIETVEFTNKTGDSRKYLRLTTDNKKIILIRISDAQEREISMRLNEEEEAKMQLKMNF